jgi:hypothetical protein
MKKFLTAVIFALAFVATPASAFTMDAQGGICNSVSHMGDFNMSFYGHLWYPIDQMVFAGVGVGYEELDNVGYIPVSGSLWVRLPIGRTVLPIATGDFGYMFGKDDQMFWRAGGGLDIKNGDRTSIIVSTGYQFLNHSGEGYRYLQAGILIEM